MKPTGKLAYAYKTISELEAQLAALKEENDRLKERSHLLDRRVAALVEIIQECGCDDAEEPANEG